MPLTFRFTLNKTAGRKGGDESGPMRDHRVTSKPWQKRRNSIAEKQFGRWQSDRGGLLPGRVRGGGHQNGNRAPSAGWRARHSRPNLPDTSFRVCANLRSCDESTDSAMVPARGLRVGVNQLRNMILGEFREGHGVPTR